MRLTLDKHTEYARELLQRLAPQLEGDLVAQILAADQSDEVGLYDQVEVEGKLSLQKTTRKVFVMDGDTRMRSAWTLQVHEMRTVRPAGAVGRSSTDRSFKGFRRGDSTVRPDFRNSIHFRK